MYHGLVYGEGMREYEPQGPVEWFLYTVAVVSGALGVLAIGVVVLVVAAVGLWDLVFG